MFCGPVDRRMSDADLHRRLDTIELRQNIIIALLVIPYALGLLAAVFDSSAGMVVVIVLGLVLAGFVFLWLVFRPEQLMRG